MWSLKNLIKDNLQRNGVLALVILVLLEIASIVGWFWPVVGSIIALILVLGWLMLAIKNLPLAIIVLIAELIVGSFGYIVSFNFGSTELSLRLGLFLAAFGVMIYRLTSNREHVIFTHPWRWWFVGALGSLLWAAGRGYYNWNSLDNLFLDANGYVYILLLPLFLEGYIEAGSERLLKYARQILAPSIIWLTLRTISLLYLFTHFGSESLVWLYKWYRDSGLGEITPAGGGFFRIFSQSHLYSALASVLGFAWLWRYLSSGQKITSRQPMVIFTLLSLVALLASLSRSLWLGTAVAWFLIPLLSAGTKRITRSLWYLLTSLVLVASAVGVVLFVSRSSWPVKPLGSASAQAFASRFGAEPAGQARLKLLPPLLEAIKNQPILGSGFGSTVSYFSTDPRAVASTAGGSGFVTTYAFEWGWLDLWYKFGLVGLLFYAAWLLMPWWRGFKYQRQGHLLGLITPVLTALYITHLTTPYLNHPLGLGAVLALGTFVLASNND